MMRGAAAGRGRAPLAFLLVVLALCSQPAAAVVGWEYAVVIDAGSTGSRVHVFRFYRHKDFPYASIELPDAAHKTTPGLSSYSFDPKTAANSLQPLLKFAREAVPREQWARTPLQLMATAGLRMLPEDQADRILEEARRVLAGSGFLFRPAWARVISGQQEGLYGWVSINYATGALQALVQQQQQARLGRKELPGGVEPVKATHPLMGVLELGGGSLQVTFALDRGRRIPPNQAAAVAMPGLSDRQLYSHSFDGFGLQAALKKHEAALAAAGAKADPCLPVGYRASSGVAGSGDFDACQRAARALLPSERCTFSSCSLGNVFTPPVEGPLIGIDNFYYSARALQLKPGQIKITDYEAAARKFCRKSWDAIKREFLKHSTGSDTYTLKVCFAAAHVLTVLRDGLHLNGTSAGVILSNEVPTHKGGTFSSSWTLGAVVVEVLRIGLGADDPAGPLSVSGGLPSAAAPLYARLPSAPRTDGGAAALAAGYCLGLILLCVVLSRMRVGVIDRGGPLLEKVGSGNPESEMAALISVQVNGSSGGALGRAGAGGGGGGGGGAAANTGGRASAIGSRRRADAL